MMAKNKISEDWISGDKSIFKNRSLQKSKREYTDRECGCFWCENYSVFFMNCCGVLYERPVNERCWAFKRRKKGDKHMIESKEALTAQKNENKNRKKIYKVIEDFDVLSREVEGMAKKEAGGH